MATKMRRVVVCAWQPVLKLPTPPPNLFFQRPKNENSPLKTAVHIWFLPKKSGLFLFRFRTLLSKILLRWFHLLRKTSDLALKNGILGAKIAFFCFSVESFVTPFSSFANDKRAYPTSSTTLGRLRWQARPSERNILVFAIFLFQHRQKKVLFAPAI